MRFAVTHPFHPLAGREFELVMQGHVWDRMRVYFHDDAGGLRCLPTEWTSLAPADPFLVVAEGRARFRPGDLAQLVDLIEGLREAATSTK